MSRLGNGGRLVRRVSPKAAARRLEWDPVKAEIRERDGAACRACQAAVRFDVPADDLRYGHPHHILSRGRGGADTTSNSCVLCAECHRRAHSHIAERLFIAGDANDWLTFTCQGRTWMVAADGRINYPNRTVDASPSEGVSA